MTVAAIAANLVPAGVPLILVGVAERVSPGHVYTDFCVNDSTGRLGVRFFCPPQDVAFAAGTYIHIVGRLSTCTPTYIITERVRSVATADEVAYHQIETAFTYLRLHSSCHCSRSSSTTGGSWTP